MGKHVVYWFLHIVFKPLFQVINHSLGLRLFQSQSLTCLVSHQILGDIVSSHY